jgi:hypothetical protein
MNRERTTSSTAPVDNYGAHLLHKLSTHVRLYSSLTIPVFRLGSVSFDRINLNVKLRPSAKIQQNRVRKLLPSAERKLSGGLLSTS